jgi:hypothetical protein
MLRRSHKHLRINYRFSIPYSLKRLKTSVGKNIKMLTLIIVRIVRVITRETEGLVKMKALVLSLHQTKTFQRPAVVLKKIASHK